MSLSKMNTVVMLPTNKPHTAYTKQLKHGKQDKVRYYCHPRGEAFIQVREKNEQANKALALRHWA